MALSVTALTCDRQLCCAAVLRRGLTAEEVREVAREDGWHVFPCDCTWKLAPGYRWKHQRDYCPSHFPQAVRDIENLPPLLRKFTALR